jgi:hypothetical protein
MREDGWGLDRRRRGAAAAEIQSDLCEGGNGVRLKLGFGSGENASVCLDQRRVGARGRQDVFGLLDRAWTIQMGPYGADSGEGKPAI